MFDYFFFSLILKHFQVRHWIFRLLSFSPFNDDDDDVGQTKGPPDEFTLFGHHWMGQFGFWVFKYVGRFVPLPKAAKMLSATWKIVTKSHFNFKMNSLECRRFRIERKLIISGGVQYTTATPKWPMTNYDAAPHDSQRTVVQVQCSCKLDFHSNCVSLCRAGGEYKPDCSLCPGLSIMFTKIMICAILNPFCVAVALDWFIITTTAAIVIVCRRCNNNSAWLSLALNMFQIFSMNANTCSCNQIKLLSPTNFVWMCRWMLIDGRCIQ